MAYAIRPNELELVACTYGAEVKLVRKGEVWFLPAPHIYSKIY
jgi:hypothetical protein